MLDLDFTALAKKPGEPSTRCCVLGRRASCRNPAEWLVGFRLKQDRDGARRFRKFCTKHASRLAARNGGGTITLTDLMKFKEKPIAPIPPV